MSARFGYRRIINRHGQCAQIPNAVSKPSFRDSQCFICLDTGHWAKQCPNSSPAIKKKFKSPSTLRHDAERLESFKMRKQMPFADVEDNQLRHLLQGEQSPVAYNATQSFMDTMLDRIGELVDKKVTQLLSSVNQPTEPSCHCKSNTVSDSCIQEESSIFSTSEVITQTPSCELFDQSTQTESTESINNVTQTVESVQCQSDASTQTSEVENQDIKTLRTQIWNLNVQSLKHKEILQGEHREIDRLQTLLLEAPLQPPLPGPHAPHICTDWCELNIFHGSDGVDLHLAGHWLATFSKLCHKHGYDDAKSISIAQNFLRSEGADWYKTSGYKSTHFAWFGHSFSLQFDDDFGYY